jgi:hypothetical protein
VDHDFKDDTYTPMKKPVKRRGDDKRKKRLVRNRGDDVGDSMVSL